MSGKLSTGKAVAGTDHSAFDRLQQDDDSADWFLGHRRLAVLDLTANASQPMCNEDGRCWVLFNGEIYNHRELRHLLVNRGHRFATDHSDTEVLLHGYEEWGDRIVTHLRGMFAFAILDLTVGSVLMARDWFGEKPLYYASDHRGIAFGSEPRAVLMSGFVAGTMHVSAVSDYLTFGYVPAPRTIYSDVRKLRAAEVVSVSLDMPDHIAPRRYWDLQFRPERVTNAERWHEEFEALLEDAVGVRLESDVPLGAFLSGGLDSTSIVQKMALTETAPHTFTVGFEEHSVDETRFAHAVARRLGTVHRVRRLEHSDLLDALGQMPQVFDEPFADSSAIAMLALARMTRDDVTVVLSGDGGDELLGGYDRYFLNSALEAVFDGKFGRVAGACAAPLVRLWPDSMRGNGFVRLLTIGDDWLAAQSIVGASDQRAFAESWDGRTPDLVNRMCKSDLSLYLPEDLMTKVDRVCMSVGLESRAPFLDRALFEFVAKAPAWLKGTASHASKAPLRRIVKRTCGDKIAGRSKQGFAVPLGQWFRRELRELIQDEVSAPGSFVASLFPVGFVSTIVNNHVHGSRDLSNRIWMLLVLERWHKQFDGAICRYVDD
jgi:asparagine synthase (glutamine-hydrolysing)